MSTGASGRNWAFDGFKVMTEMRLLLSGDAPVPLTAKAFDTLVVLIENRDRVVTKDELLQSIWPDVEVEEGNLTQQIFLLRKALGETAQQPRHIVTVPGHGYRFTASVRAISNEPAVTALSSNGAASAPTTPRRGVTFIATALVALGVITLGLSWMPSEKGAAPDFTRHIAKITESGKATFSAISRDGRYVAYVENDGDEYSLWLKPVGTEGRTPLIPPQPFGIFGPSFSPDGEHIYFVRQGPRPMGVLYRIPTLGGLETPVLEDVDSQVSFSPDGREFVFQRGTAEGSAIVVAPARGGPQRNLATLEYPLRFSLFAPDWSPDGKVVAVVAVDTSNQSRSIILLSVDDGGRRVLYSTENHIGRLRWLPDGSGLLAIIGKRLERLQFGRVTGTAVWRIENPSGRAERLTSDLANHDPCCLDIGANGSLVANVINTFVSDLWIARADRPDSLIRQVTSDHPVVGRHSWLPDSDTIVYHDLTGRVKTVSKDGRASSLPMPDGQEVIGPVSSCGDGRYVVFSAMPGKNIWRVAPSGGQMKLTSGFNDFNPACSPDGKRVLYASREPNDKYPSLWQVSIEGGEPTPLNVASSYDVLPSPTGRMIFYQTDWVEPGADRNRPDRREVISSSDRTRLLAVNVTGDSNIGMMTNWAPDESGLDYVVTRDGVSNIWRQPLTGGPPVQITHLSVGRIFTFAWSPDGQWLSLGIGVSRSDVVLMSSEPYPVGSAVSRR